MKTFFTIWTRPVETFEYLDMMEEQDLKVRMNLLFLLGSLAMMIPRIPYMVVKYKSMGDQSLAFSIIMCLIGVGMSILFLKFIQSFVIWMIGKMLQGKASKFQVQLVLAYALVPAQVSLIISMVLVIAAIIGKDIALIGYQNTFTMVIIMIFAVRTFIIGIAKFNRFSYGYALLNLCLVAAIFEGIGLGSKYLGH